MVNPKNILSIGPQELKVRMDAGEVELLLDVREDWEHSLAAIAGSTHIPLGELIDRMQELAFEEDIVVYCHFGERSRRAAVRRSSSRSRIAQLHRSTFDPPLISITIAPVSTPVRWQRECFPTTKSPLRRGTWWTSPAPPRWTW